MHEHSNHAVRSIDVANLEYFEQYKPHNNHGNDGNIMFPIFKIHFDYHGIQYHDITAIS